MIVVLDCNQKITKSHTFQRCLTIRNPDRKGAYLDTTTAACCKIGVRPSSGAAPAMAKEL
jgi:hypothetical protein